MIGELFVAVIAAAAGGVVAAAGLEVATRTLDRPPHIRANFRGREVIGTAGIVLLAGLAAVGAISLIERDGRRAAWVMVATGTAAGILGYIDDVYGDRRAGGLVGHARALLKGTPTTGMLKAAGGAVSGLLAAWALGWRGPWIVVAGAVVALSANLANLFDLRPGRAIKLWLPVAILLALAVELDGPQIVLAGLAGAVVTFAWWELQERVMLGDTGAGLLGAVAGVGAIAVLGRAGLVVTAVILLALTLASEVVSFSRVIDAIPPLRWFDRLGRSPD